MFTVFSKGLFAGAGGVYFQPQYDSDTLLALLSRTPKGEQRQLCLYKSWVIKGVFGSSTVQKGVVQQYFHWQVSIHPYFT